MKKNYDYDKIEKRIKEGFEGVERDIRFRHIEEVSVKKEKERRAPGPALQIIGAVLAAAIVGGGTFGALKYAEYKGSRIAPGSDPGIDSVYTEYGSVTSFYEDVQPAELAKNFTFRGVTVIDTDKVTEDELKTALPLDHYYGSVRGVISEAAEKAGYEVFTYKLAAGEGVCVTKDGVGVLVFDRASTAISRVPSRLIIADETPSGHGMIFFTQYTDFSGRYGGMTSVFAYDTVTGETAPVDVFLSDDDPVSVGMKSSPGAVGYYGDAVIGYDENTGFINYQETFDPIYVESSDRKGEALLSNPYRLGYIDGKYVIGMPNVDQPDNTVPSNTTDTGTEFKGEYGLAIECDNVAGCPPVYASRVYKGGELISQKTDEAKAFACQISRDVGLNDLLPLHNNIRTPWAVISVEVGGERFESVALAEEWIKDRIRVSSSTVNGFEITVTVTWDTVPGSDNTARLPADDRTEYSYRFTAKYMMLHDTVPADERVLIEYSDGKLRFTRIAAEPEFTVEKNGDMKASELDIHKLFAMLDGHDALDDPWDLVPSVTLRMTLDGETIYAFEMSYDGAVNVMRYHGSDRGFVASMKLTADEIKTLSGESGHDATETTAPAPEETTERIPTVPVEHGIQIAELQSWLSRRMWNGMNEGELLNMATGEKDLKKAIFAMAYDQIDREDDGTFVRYKTEYCDFLYFAEKDTFRIREARMILRPGTNFSLPFGVTLDMSPEEALSAMGYTEEEIVSLNGNPVSAGDYNINYNGITLTVTYTYGNAAFGLELGGEAQAYLEIE